MGTVNWPAGYPALLSDLRLHCDKILTGTLIAIDPAALGDSLPGYAIFRGGKLEFSGAIPKPKAKPINKRLQYLYDEIAALVPVPPDVVVIEEIHKSMAHASLLWAVGVSIAASRAPVMLQCPLNFWKSVAKATPTYKKSDVSDAEMIGKSIILWVQQYKDSLGK